MTFGEAFSQPRAGRKTGGVRFSAAARVGTTLTEVADAIREKRLDAVVVDDQTAYVVGESLFAWWTRVVEGGEASE